MSEVVLSVVVPFWGVERYFADCLESLRMQTLQNIEVIMVDDGSKDGSRRVAEHYSDIDRRFVLLTQENQGLGPARNTGARSARGKFLAFADSDDVIPPRAYEMLTSSLEATGSSLAAGNVDRFIRKGSTSQSWTHRIAFSRSEQGTHILRNPGLVADRMVWNKVFRRDFWERRQFEFPAIRYEDFPVVLRAHLEADAVDVIHHKVYFWRDRDDGTSITQKSLELDNLADRLASAHMVTELVKDTRLSGIRRLVHTHLIDTDLLVMARAAIGPGPDAGMAMELAHELADQLNPVIRAGGMTTADHIHAALRAGNRGILRELLSPNRRRKAKAVALSAPHTVPAQVIKRARSRVQSINGKRRRRLRSDVVDVASSVEGLRIRVRPKLRSVIALRATPSAVLVGHSNVRVPVAVQSTGKLFEILLSDQLGALSASGLNGFALLLTLKLGPVTWQGPLAFKPSQYPGALRMPDGDLVQLVSYYDRYQKQHCLRITQPVGARLVTRVVREESSVALHVPSVNSGVAAIMVNGQPEVMLPIVDGWFFVAADQVEDSEPIDNPVTGISERRLMVFPEGDAPSSLLLACPSVSADRNGVRWAILSAQTGELALRRTESIVERNHWIYSSSRLLARGAVGGVSDGHAESTDV